MQYWRGYLENSKKHWLSSESNTAKDRESRSHNQNHAGKHLVSQVQIIYERLRELTWTSF